MNETTVPKFETKDSGKRQEFASGMVRDTQDDKIRYDLAFDGPLFWNLFKGSKFEGLVFVAQKWYEFHSLENAVQVIQAIAVLEGGLFMVVERYAGLMMRGAIKYSEQNWMRATGIEEYKRFKSSFCRHFKQYLNGETDEDHMAAIFFNLNGVHLVMKKLTAQDQKEPLAF